ncbi:MAG: shikimate dehydrogenase [Anaerolineae bacterium]|jgi:shikimate dehydrogenase
MSERSENMAAPAVPIYGHTQVAGVIGWPIAHSVSPPMHNAAFRALGLDWCYVPYAVPPERLTQAVAGFRGLGLRGLNATVPHKQALLALVDELTPAARAIGAVNTLRMVHDILVGHNTDAAGFIRALREAGFEPEGCRALVLGAGGAARAVVYALAEQDARITVLNRTVERAQSLAADMAGIAREPLDAAALDADTLADLALEATLIVNATSLGMHPATENSPWPEEVPYPTGAFCYDLIYNPRETRLMRRAREVGARAVDGLGMLIHQGAEAFEWWTGVAAPIHVMRAACEAVLGEE